MQGTYFFSFRSPYSWLASMRLKTQIDNQSELELVPFWEPDDLSLTRLKKRGGDFPYRQMSDAKHRYILNDIRRLTKKYGLDIKWPVDKEPWWELSHLGYLKAQQLGCGNAFFWQTYCARWQKGLDISQPLVISKLCRDAGIRKSIVDKILEAPQDPQIRELGVSILYRIYREDIFGVPMFTKKRMQFWGLDRLNDFLEATDHSLRTTNDLNMMQGYPLDFDHAGGCG